MLRICLGLFFFFEGLGKIRWFLDTSPLAGMFASWSQAAPPGSVSHWYLERIAVPGVAIFARLVPLGEMTCGLALLLGIWTPLFAMIAFFMALNFQIASGARVQVQLSDQRLRFAGARRDAGAGDRRRASAVEHPLKSQVSSFSSSTSSVES